MIMTAHLIHCFTVAESKRLIAKAIAKLLHPELGKRMIAIARGTTCGYVCEEMLGRSIDKTSYVIGHVFPEKTDSSKVLNKSIVKDVILKNGHQVDMTVVNSVNDMREGDIFIKGANCLNYGERIAGILVGSLQGGTIGAVLPTIQKKKIRLIIPVGLEKSCSESVERIAIKLNVGATYKGQPLQMVPIKGEIITEIEALKILTGVHAVQIAAGGIGGAEGGVMLYIEGTPVQVKKAADLIQGIQMEKPFVN
jgi:hypothetical protein